MISKFSVCSYVAYTATPFANVLIDSSSDDDLFPKDFLITLDKPVGYVGAEELFGRESIEPRGALDGLPVIRTIPDDDSLQYVTGKKTKNEERNQLTQSVLQAIDSFVVGCSIRLCRGQWNQHMTMLIHTSHVVSQHEQFKEQVEEYLLNMKLEREEEDEALKARFKELCGSDFFKISKSLKAEDLFEFDLVWKNSKKFIDRLIVVMENHTSEERLSYSSTDPLS